jgi:hypothetical protein
VNVKCNKCGFIGPEGDFPKGRDFFQNNYVASCPKCDNRQSPGDASMRMFGGERPFSFIRDTEPEGGIELLDNLDTIKHRANEAS